MVATTIVHGFNEAGVRDAGDHAPIVAARRTI